MELSWLCKFNNSCLISLLNVASKFESGSSNKNNFGSLTIALPIATLCFCPPEIWVILFFKRLCHNKQLINSHFYRGVSELPYKLLFAVIYTHLEFRSIVLQDIHSMLGNIMIDEEKAKEYFRREKAKQTADCRYSDEKQLRAFQQRFSEMDKLIQSAFEEKVLGKLPESVCISLCEKYQAEKISLKEKISELEQRLAESDEEDKQAEEYIARLKKYGKCETLTREMCLQLIKFITIGERPAIGEQREIHIYYKFIDKETLENFQKSKIKQ